MALATNDEMSHVENQTKCLPFKPPETSSSVGRDDAIEKSGK